MSMIELEQRTIDKIKGIGGADPINAMQKFLAVRPVGSKNKEVIKQDLECFQNIMSKVYEKDFDPLIKSLKEEEV